MIGIDITPEMLEVGSIKIARFGLEDRIDLRVGDAEHIDLPDNSVDGCCSAFTVRNLTDIRQGFREMLRVVRPGSRVVCLEISHPPGKIFGSLFYLYFYKLAPLFGTIIGKAFELLQRWPVGLGERLVALAARKPSATSASLLERLFGPMQHFLREELQSAELAFLRATYEQHIQMMWRIFGQNHRLRSSGQQLGFDFD